MIIAGAGGHAREVMGVLEELHETEDVYFFDDFDKEAPSIIWRRFPILHNVLEAKEIFLKDPRFIIGVGNPALRKLLADKLVALGGKLFSVISPYSKIGTYNVDLQEGLNIMTGAVITQDITIETGTLVHINATIHHDCHVGKFCELSPGCHLLGKVEIGDLVSIGSNAVLLPGIKVGEKSIIGAGAVVTKNVSPGTVVKGVPAK